MELLGEDYAMVHYDEYLKDFEELALPEYKNDAESLLRGETEEYSGDGETVEIYLEAEKTKK